MLSDGKGFDTNIFFSGGAGMFIQYHDIVKPVHLYAVWKMLLTNETYGLPLDMLKKQSILSFIEWYMRRRYCNPLQCLDFTHSVDPIIFDRIMKMVLVDDTIYKMAPLLNIHRLLGVYRQQHMSFPIYVYTKDEEPYVETDVKLSICGIDIKYLYGDLEEAIKHCGQNFTYIFSDVELLRSAASILHGTCSHLLLASDYRYNQSPSGDIKYDLRELAADHPFIRIGLTQAVDMDQLAMALAVRR